VASKYYRELEHTQFNQRTLNVERWLYEEASMGQSWFSVGRAAKLEGTHHQIAGTAQRMARSYSRLYRQEWPIEIADAKEGQEALDMAMQGSSWDDIALQLKYVDAVQAREHVAATAARTGFKLELIEIARLGKASYDQRTFGVSWEAIASVSNATERKTIANAKAYAQATGKPWPIVFAKPKPPPKPPKIPTPPITLTAEQGKIAYFQKLWHNQNWSVIATNLEDENATVKRLQEATKAYALSEGKPWPVRHDPYAWGALIYARRVEANILWKEIAGEFGSLENTVKVAAKKYALHAKQTWPLRYRPPAWGEIAYKRRAESNESWKVIADDLGLDWEYLIKEAKKYALNSNSPWPMPVPARLYRDTAAEAYHLRATERLSWVDIGVRLGISRAWAIRSAQQHVKTHNAPWPIRLEKAESVEETAYVMREQGHGWEDIAETMKCSLGVAQDRARRFAVRTGKPWPLQIAPVRTVFSARAKEAYERGYKGHEPWPEVAKDLDYANGQSCQNSARVYAERFGLPLHIRRRGKLTRDPDRPRQSYEARQNDPAASWSEIGERLGYKAWRSAFTAAQNWAEDNGLPWPPETAEREVHDERRQQGGEPRSSACSPGLRD